MVYVSTEWMKNNESNIEEIRKLSIELRQKKVINGNDIELLTDRIDAYCYGAKHGMTPEQAIKAWQQMKWWK